MLFQDINAWTEGREAPSAAYSSNNYMRRGSRRTSLQLYRSVASQVKPATPSEQPVNSATDEHGPPRWHTDPDPGSPVFVRLLGRNRQVKTPPDLVVVVRQLDWTIRLA
jgi:hypothetical protein